MEKETSEQRAIRRCQELHAQKLAGMGMAYSTGAIWDRLSIYVGRRRAAEVLNAYQRANGLEVWPRKR
jgi:hypothetical protein